MKSLHPTKHKGYTLIEVVAAAGLISGAIGAASALGMTVSKQEELTRGHLAAVRYAEAIARLWQLGVAPGSVLLAQPQGATGSTGTNPMTWTISSVSSVTLGDDGGIAQGVVEKVKVTVTYVPYGSSGTRNIEFNVVRPVAGHR